MPDDLLTPLADRPWIALLALGALLLFLLAGRSRRRSARYRRSPGGARPGEVWFAMVPFEDGTGAKDRPVLVLATLGGTCTVARMTSQDRSARDDYVRVPAGLPGLHRASWISLRPQRLHVTALRRRVGDPGAALLIWYRAQPTPSR